MSQRSMPARSRKPVIIAVAASIVLIAAGLALLLDGFSSSSAAPQTPAISAIPSTSSIAEGPGGRTALTRWTLRRDPGNVGLGRGWAKGGFSGSPVSVPNVVQPLPITGAAGVRNYDGSVAWYRTTVSAPRAGTYVLHFESANFLAQVWVDGHSLGSHKGTYLPFELRTALTAGPHTLVVRVDWRNPEAQAAQGYHRTWFNFGGINGEVNVRPVGASELSSPTIQTHLTPDSPTAQTASVRLSVQVRNNEPSRTIGPQGLLVHGSQEIPFEFPAQTVAQGQTKIFAATVAVPSPALWSPSSPNLYQLTLAVGSESSYSAHVGLRRLTWSRGKMYLNGSRLVLHGASIQEDAQGHGDALTPADQASLVSELKATGANATRSQHPLDPALLEKLDAAGILVWQGVGPVDPAGDWSETTPKMMNEAQQRVRTTVQEAALHPSIIAWNLANEVAGNGHRGGQAQYVQTMSRWLHAYDPGRMAAVDVWGDHPPKPGAVGPLYRYVDAVAETDYSGWYDRPHDTPAQVTTLIRTRLKAMHATFPGKVQIISEFGAESNSLNPTNSPGGYAFQSRLLALHVAAYEADPQLSGMLVWDLRDFALTPTFAGGSIVRELPGIKLLKGLNQKGLYSYGNQAKPAAGVIGKLFKALPAD